MYVCCLFHKYFHNTHKNKIIARRVNNKSQVVEWERKSEFVYKKSRLVNEWGINLLAEKSVFLILRNITEKRENVIDSRSAIKNNSEIELEIKLGSKKLTFLFSSSSFRSDFVLLAYWVRRNGNCRETWTKIMSVINKLRKSLAGSGKGFFYANTLTVFVPVKIIFNSTNGRRGN